MLTEKEWRDRAKQLLKAELRRRKVSYRELVGLLEERGVHGENPLNIANKLARGRFSAVFLIQCLTAIGCRQIRLVFEDD
jgi:hypothetical protein